MKIITALILSLATLVGYPDVARFGVMVVDSEDGRPLPGVDVRANFEENIGWRAWTESSMPDVDIQTTDVHGLCRMKGKTNCGNVCCWVRTPPKGYYAGRGWGHAYTNKNLFGVWQPDNLVATIRLQRVEHPIPLWVKRVELRDFERGIGGFDGTNSVLRFDLMKGDWLPPYGNGEVDDVRIDTEVCKTGSERRFLPQEGVWGVLQFYDLVTHVVLRNGDYLSQETVSRSAGIKIRSAEKEADAVSVTRTKGKRKQIDRNNDWYCEYFSDADPDRCYTFRIRSRRNGKGELVEAYYGKIYGDFEFEGDDKKGLIGVKFLYYLNPTSLDRNLEWDMKNNLYPDSGLCSVPEP